MNQPQGDKRHSKASKAPSSAPAGRVSEAPRPGGETPPDQQPVPEDEARDPVGDGHSDADLAERLPPS